MSNHNHSQQKLPIPPPPPDYMPPSEPPFPPPPMPQPPPPPEPIEPLFPFEPGKFDKFDPKILAFCCNWCSYAGADLAGVSRIQYPSNIRIIRVMCSGRVEIPFILRGLLAGADGVLVTGCHIGDCHYIGGNESADKRIKTVRELLNMLGVGDNRIRLEWISAAEGQKFAETVKEFTRQIKSIGPAGFGNLDLKSAEPLPVKPLNEIIQETNVWRCMSCGKCSGICPVTRNDSKYLPRNIVESAVVKDREAFEKDPAIWQCLTCGRCSKVCPGNVEYTEFIKQARFGATRQGLSGECAHLGMLQDMMKIMSNDHLEQKRLGWITDETKVGKKGEVLYFTGCLPYFDVLFKEIEPNLLDIARSTVRLINRTGVTPIVFENEKCCGHDLLWSGDRVTFRKLAQHNIDLIKKSGVKKIIFSCPECYRTFKIDYPEQLGSDVLYGIELEHISEYLSKAIEDGKLKLNSPDVKPKVTYHDPCRLGHHLGVYNAPRELIKTCGDLVEMEHSRETASCCGTSTWLNCNASSKSMQTKSLKEAKEIAGKLITACPKCLIHFKCAMNEKDNPMEKTEISDLLVFIDSTSKVE